MTESRSPHSPTRGLLVGAVFAGLALGGAWISGVFSPRSSSSSAVAAGANPGADTAGLASAAERAAPPLPPRSPPPPAETSANDVAKRARQTVWRDVAARTPGPGRGPLVIGLHGRGDSAANFAHLAPRFPGPLAWRFVQASAPFGRGFAWFLRGAGGRPEGIADSVAAIHQQVLSAGAGRPVGLFGFSQGCMMIVHYLVTHPDHVKAAACVGGSVVGALATDPGGRTRPPILFVNGTADRVVPAEDTRAAKQRLEGLGFPTEHIEHGGGHTVPAGEIDRIGSWLLAKLMQR